MSSPSTTTSPAATPRWMGQIYNFLGLTTGIIVHGLTDEERTRRLRLPTSPTRTNNELGFDYLRDNMKYARNQMVQRGHNYAIVDEVDSILIDEARTPLIISGPLDDRSDLYNKIDALHAADRRRRLRARREAALGHLHRGAAPKSSRDLLRDAGLLKGETLYDIENVALVHHVNIALQRPQAVPARTRTTSSATTKW